MVVVGLDVDAMVEDDGDDALRTPRSERWNAIDDVDAILSILFYPIPCVLPFELS